jgi:hypothetical protein
MLLFLVKAFSSVIWDLMSVGLLRTDTTGMGRSRQEGRLLLGHEVSRGKGIRSGRQIG